MAAASRSTRRGAVVQPFARVQISLDISKIEKEILCVAALRDQNVFVSTSDGKLHLLRLPEVSFSGDYPDKISPTNKDTSLVVSPSAPVTQLVPILSKNLVIAVSGKQMVVCGIGPDGAILKYPIQYPMKGKVDLVCVDESKASSVRVCAVSHPEIHLYTLVDGHKLSAKEGLHYTPGRATSVALLQDCIAVGYVKPCREYNLIRTNARGTVDTLPVIPVQRDDLLVVRTGDNEVLFTTSAASKSSNECVGMFCNGAGVPTRPPITWPDPPTDVFRCDPYIVGVNSGSSAVRVHWFSGPHAGKQVTGQTSSDAGTLMQTALLPFKPAASCAIAMWGPSGRIGWQESVLLAGRRGPDKRPCMELLVQASPEQQSTALLCVGMHESAETLAIMREQLREAEAVTSMTATAERQAASRVFGRRRGGPAYTAGGRARGAGLYEGAGGDDVDDTADRLPVLLAVEASTVIPPALPQSLESQRRLSMLGDEPEPPSAAVAKTRGPNQAHALAGVAPRDTVSQSALAHLDEQGASALRGVGLDGRQLPPALRQFHTLAGCVMLLRLQFDKALRHLCLGALDPREVVWLSPALHDSSFSYSPEVLTRGLCSAVARGEETPALAALSLEERGFDRSLAVSDIDLTGIIESVRAHQFKTAAALIEAEDAASAGAKASASASASASAGASSAASASLSVAGARREEWGASCNTVRHAARAIAAAGSAKPSASDMGGTSVIDTEMAALRMLQQFLLQRRQFPETSWLTAAAREDLDSALIRIMTFTGSIAELCAFVSRETDLSVGSSADFFAKQGLAHVLALLERARGSRSDALERWRGIYMRPSGDRAISKLCTGHPDTMRRFWHKHRTRKGAGASASASATHEPAASNAQASSRVAKASPPRSKTKDPHHHHDHDHRHKKPTEADLTIAMRAMALTCAVETLQTTDDLSLVRSACDWVALASPRRCLSVFCCPRRISLPVKETRPLLADLDKAILRSRARGEEVSGSAIGSGGTKNGSGGALVEDGEEDFVLRPLEQRFLFYLVYAVGKTDAQIHTALARSLIAALLQCRGETASAARREAGAESKAASLSAARHAAHKYRQGVRDGAAPADAAATALDAMEERDSFKGTRQEPGTEVGSEGELRRDLLELLRYSGFYDAPRLLGAIGGTSLLEERVLLHGRTGNHAAAIQVCLAEMGDLARAESYCNDTYLAAREEAAIAAGASESGIEFIGGRGPRGGIGSGAAGAASKRNPFMELFRQMQGGVAGGEASATSGAMLPEALLLMERHARKVALTQAMEALPDTVSVSSVSHLLRRLVPAAESRYRAARVIQHVSELERLQANVELTRAQQHYAVVNRDTTCSESGQPLNRQRFVLRAPRLVDDAPITDPKLEPVLQSVAAKRHK